MHDFRILTINSGSSSIKIALYEIGEVEDLILSGSIDRIGMTDSSFHIQQPNGETLIREQNKLPDHHAAFNRLFDWLEKHEPEKSLDAIGHRIVHGGPTYSRPVLITPALIEDLEDLVHLAPDHLPHEIRAIQSASHSYPKITQVACFDTAFHRNMPDLAQIIALPRKYQQEGIIRYGFHGLSYEYILQELAKEAGKEAANRRIIVAHLGNGASMVAVWRGRSMDTTMGFTPASGLVMSTRAGDLDPGVLIYLLENKGFTSSELNELVNQQAGLLGVSGISSDMKELLDKEGNEQHAREAVDLFCYQASKHIGSLASVLGGLDTLIFTGGIGENSARIRQRICQNMSYLGVFLDPQRNQENLPIISRENSPVTVRKMKTDEDLMIARHTYSLIRD